MEKLGESSADSITDMTDDGMRKIEEYENLHPSHPASYIIPGINTDLLNGPSDSKIIKAS